MAEAAGGAAGVSAPGTPFDADALAAIHDAGPDQPAGWVLRRGLALAAERAAALAAPGALWIDAGCGTGHMAARLAAGGTRVVGLDRDPSMARWAARRWGGAARFAVADVERLPLPDARADGVVAVSLLGCLADPGPFLRECARVLRPGGAFLATATNAASASVFVDRALAALGAGDRRGAAPAAGGHGRFRLHRAAPLVRACGDAGLAVERLVAYGHLPPERWRDAASFTRARARERDVHSSGLHAGARNLLVVARRVATPTAARR